MSLAFHEIADFKIWLALSELLFVQFTGAFPRSMGLITCASNNGNNLLSKYVLKRFSLVLLSFSSINIRILANHCDELHRHGVRRVYVTSIIERGSFPTFTGLTPENLTPEKFNNIRHAVNKGLRKKLGSSFIDVGKKIKYPRHYDDDLVHPGFKHSGIHLLKCITERCLYSYLTG